MPNFSIACISVVYEASHDESAHSFDNFFGFCHIPEHKIETGVSVDISTNQINWICSLLNT